MPGRVYYNKLIRDKIPEKIAKEGSACEVRELSDEEFEFELVKKVEEEARGMANSASREELMSELADVEAVLDEIKKLKNVTSEELETFKERNFEKKGGFDKRLFLIWSSDDGYTSNESKNTQ
jgi:predicted house-cleaning noncanonical NTP pyrophosphatase (MazG superfamily)